MRTTQTTTIFASLLIALAVVLSGTHAKDLATLSLPAWWSDTKKQIDDSTHQVVKVAADLHNHVDKTVKVQSLDNTSHQADSRSLRLLHHKKDVLSTKLSDRLRLWWQMSALYLS